METHNAPALRLIVGLGNPDEKYALTRHNAGFWFVDALAQSLPSPDWHNDPKFFAHVLRAAHHQHDYWLLKPTTYMNLSGKAVAALAHFYKIAPTDILVVHDELDLPTGVARFKEGSGHNGHNGLKSIIDGLGSADFWRLRIGIGRPSLSGSAVSYVLEKPTDAEKKEVNQAIDDAIAVFDLALAKNMTSAMQILHSNNA